MALKIVELFGYSPLDATPRASAARSTLTCPIRKAVCTKTLSDGTISGVCTVQQIVNDRPIVICPIRLYASQHHILLEVAQSVFGAGIRLVSPNHLDMLVGDGRDVILLGKGAGREVRLPKAKGRGGFFVDWILASVDSNYDLAEFVAVEVQSIDTTGNYRAERDAYLNGQGFAGSSEAGLNWENVSKRILPQLIYKGHVLRRERLCKGGLFFVCPTAVYEKIRDRLAGDLLEYTPQPGTITFQHYELAKAEQPGELRRLQLAGQITTTVDQIALAFTAPKNLPEPNVYEIAIMRELKRLGA